MKRATVQASTVLVGVFLLGGLAGGASMYAYARHEQAGLIGPGHHQRRLHGLARHLDLTAEQRRQVEAVFARHRPNIEELKGRMFESCGQPLRDGIDAVDTEIRALLTPEQQQKFDELREERKRRGMHGPPPGRFGPGRGKRRGPGPRGRE